METNTMIYLALALAGAGILTAVYKQVFKSKGGARTAFMILGIVLAVYGVAGFGATQGYWELGGASGIFFTATGVPAVSDGAVTTTTTTTTGAVQQRVIDTLKAVDAKEKYSNKYDQVAGTLKFYDAGTDPSSPNANAIDTITVSAGTGSSTNAKIKTNTQYRAVFDGSTNYYAVDYGIITIPESDYNPSTGTASFSIGELMNISTFVSFLNESDLTGDINGQSVQTSGTSELNTSSSNTLTYDLSAGDGQFYVVVTIGAEGANKGIRNPVLCFEDSSTYPTTGNEVSSITTLSMSGTDFALPSELLNFWANEECISLGTEMASGSSGDVKVTYTTDDTAWGTSDAQWYMGVDDLGAFNGKDVALNKGATVDRVLLSNQD